MPRVRILNTYFDGGKPKYLAGQEYDANADTLRMVALGHAVYAVGAEVEFPAAEPMASADSQPAQPAQTADAVGEQPDTAQPEAAQDAPAATTPKRRGRPPKSAASQQTQPDSN